MPKMAKWWLKSSLVGEFDMIQMIREKGFYFRKYLDFIRTRSKDVPMNLMFS